MREQLLNQERTRFYFLPLNVPEKLYPDPETDQLPETVEAPALMVPLNDTVTGLPPNVPGLLELNPPPLAMLPVITAPPVFDIVPEVIWPPLFTVNVNVPLLDPL